MFTFTAYEKMKKMCNAVMETLRMHPPSMLFMRTVEVDVSLKQYSISALPTGSSAITSTTTGSMRTRAS